MENSWGLLDYPLLVASFKDKYSSNLINVVHYPCSTFKNAVLLQQQMFTNLTEFSTCMLLWESFLKIIVKNFFIQKNNS